MTKRKQNKNNRALVLFMCIWLLIMLILAVMKMVYANSINSLLATASTGSVRAMWAARAGVDYAVSVLLQDSTEIDSFGDSWYNSPELFRNIKVSDNTSFSIYKLQDNEIIYGISDDASKINILAMPHDIFNSSAFYEQLGTAFPDIFTDSGSADDIERYRLAGLRQNAARLGMAIEQAYGEDINLNGILDWNENDGKLRFPADNADGKLDSGFLQYSTVYSFESNSDRHGTPRININTASQTELLALPGVTRANMLWIITNRPFSTVAELFIPSITPENFMSALLTEKELDAIAKNSQQSSDEKEIVPLPLHPQVVRSIYDRLTVSAQDVSYGLININTACPEVISCLNGMDLVTAEKIVARRNQLPDGFESPAEIFSCGAVSYQQLLSICKYFTVRSNVFTIHSIGSCNLTNRTCTIEAVIERFPTMAENNKMTSDYTILFWKQL